MRSSRAATVLLAALLGLTARWVSAQTMPGTQSPGDDPALTRILRGLGDGDPAVRIRALLQISGWPGRHVPGAARDRLIDTVIGLAADPDPRVRREIARSACGVWIWSVADRPEPRIVELAVKLTDDPDRDVRYNVVYHGLSTITDKSDAVINAMLAVAAKELSYDWNLHGRIAWGLRSEKPKRLAPLFKPYWEKTGDRRQLALAAYAMFVEATGQEPPDAQRFADDNFIVRFLSRHPARLDAAELLAAFKSAAGSSDSLVEVWTSDGTTGAWGAAIVKGAAARRALVEQLRAAPQLQPAEWVIPASEQTIATLKRGMQRDEQALREKQAQARARPAASQPSYAEAFRDLHDRIGAVYPCFAMKGIDWPKIGQEMLPLAEQVKSDEEFGLLCMRLVARMEDSHAVVQPATARLPQVPVPLFDPGLACLIDDRNRPVVFHLDANGPAKQAGVTIGMAVVSVNGKPADEALEACMKLLGTYLGYSSQRTLRHDAARMFLRQMKQGEPVELVVEDPAGVQFGFKVAATMGLRYIPRSPVQAEGINDSADFGSKKLADDIGYVRVRRIREGLPDALDGAVRQMGQLKGLIIDARGNSGGGFDAAAAFRNFDPDAPASPDHPRFDGPIAVLIDERCISAGEGWVSWFVAKKRARLFGATTAGASSRKETYALSNGMFNVVIPVKAYTGFLDRPIERRGIEPDIELRPNAKDLAAGRDTVLDAAMNHLRRP